MSTLLAATLALLAGRPAIEQAWDFCHGEEGSEFTATQANSGTDTAVSGRGGWRRLSGDVTTDNSGYQYQLENAPIRFAPKDLVQCIVKQKLSSIAGEFLFGFAGVDTTLLASPPVDGFYLWKPEDVADVYVVVRRDSSEVKVKLPVIAEAGVEQTWTLQVQISDGDSRNAKAQVYLNGVLVLDDLTPWFEDVPDDADLTLSYAFLSGSATGTQYVDIDYIFFKATR